MSEEKVNRKLMLNAILNGHKYFMHDLIKNGGKLDEEQLNFLGNYFIVSSSALRLFSLGVSVDKLPKTVENMVEVAMAMQEKSLKPELEN